MTTRSPLFQPLHASRPTSRPTALAAALAAALAVTLAALSGGAAVAQPATGSTMAAPTKAAPLERSDRKFVEEAAKDGLAEVALGKLAAARGQNTQVKAFGQRMVDDHGRANAELTALAQAKGLALPTELDRSHRRHADKLGKREGHDFDRDYMDHMADEHGKDVKAFERAARDAKDPDVRAFAAKQLPVLKEHHAMARALHDTVKKDRDGAGANAAGTGTTPR